MTITGTVHHIGQTEVISDKFSKRLLVVATEDKFNNLAPIEFTKEKTGLLDGLQIGQSVSVEANVGGREYSGKYYPSITGWKLTAGQSAPPQKQSAPPQAVSAPVEDIDADMLPF
jgi:hypothetical protein